MSRGPILLIDDEIDERVALAEALRDRRWIVETAGTGRLGIDAAMKVQPRAVVTELVMADVSHVHFARSLRTCVENDVVIVGITRGSAEILAEAKVAGLDEVFTKPVNITALDRYLAAALGLASDPDDRATTEMPRLKRP
jgi:DNA-binding response OmpR family regulator